MNNDNQFLARRDTETSRLQSWFKRTDTTDFISCSLTRSATMLYVITANDVTPLSDR